MANCIIQLTIRCYVAITNHTQTHPKYIDYCRRLIKSQFYSSDLTCWFAALHKLSTDRECVCVCKIYLIRIQFTMCHFWHECACARAQKKLTAFRVLSIQFTCFKEFNAYVIDLLCVWTEEEERKKNFFWFHSFDLFIYELVVCFVFRIQINMLIWCFEFVFCLHFRAHTHTLIRIKSTKSWCLSIWSYVCMCVCCGTYNRRTHTRILSFLFIFIYSCAH